MMRIYNKVVCFIVIAICFSACSSNDKGCKKNITIPQFYTVGNQIYQTETILEVSCDTPDPSNEPVNIAPPLLENFTYEVIKFTFTPDTGNNTSRLQFEIKLNNGNNFNVKGVPILTVDIDGLISSNDYSSLATNICHEISSNSSCILTYDQESSLDLGIINNITLKDVKYYKTK